MNSDINVCHALPAIKVPTIALNRAGDEDVRCAQAISDGVRELGLHVRAGLHTGECEVVAGKIGGLAVHIGARVAAEAQPDEVVVSSTVKDLVAGSGLSFADRGHVRLRGVPGEWHLYAADPALGDYRCPACATPRPGSLRKLRNVAGTARARGRRIPFRSGASAFPDTPMMPPADRISCT